MHACMIIISLTVGTSFPQTFNVYKINWILNTLLNLCVTALLGYLTLPLAAFLYHKLKAIMISTRGSSVAS